MSYSDVDELYARRLFVEKELSAAKTAEEMGDDGPSRATIARWARKNNWREQRKEHAQQEIEKASPSNIEDKILGKIDTILDNGMDSTAAADAIAKYMRTLDKINSPKRNLQIMFDMLEEFSAFMKDNYPKIVTNDFANALLEFKNHKMEEMKK